MILPNLKSLLPPRSFREKNIVVEEDVPPLYPKSERSFKKFKKKIIIHVHPDKCIDDTINMKEIKEIIFRYLKELENIIIKRTSNYHTHKKLIKMIIFGKVSKEMKEKIKIPCNVTVNEQVQTHENIQYENKHFDEQVCQEVFIPRPRGRAPFSINRLPKIWNHSYGIWEDNDETNVVQPSKPTQKDIYCRHCKNIKKFRQSRCCT